MTWAVGCARTEVHAVDLQLVLDGSPDDAAEWVEVCVEGGPDQAFPVRDENYALTGVAPVGAVEVVAAVLDGGGALLQCFGPVEIAGPVETAREGASGEAGCGCAVTGEPADASSGPRVLGVWFSYTGPP